MRKALPGRQLNWINLLAAIRFMAFGLMNAIARRQADLLRLLVLQNRTRKQHKFAPNPGVFAGLSNIAQNSRNANNSPDGPSVVPATLIVTQFGQSIRRLDRQPDSQRIWQCASEIERGNQMSNADPFDFGDREYFWIGPKTPASAFVRFDQSPAPTAVSILGGVRNLEQHLDRIENVETPQIKHWTQQSLVMLRSFRRIRELKIGMSRGVKDLSALADIPTIETIDLVGGIGIASVAPLSRLPNLKRLRLDTFWGEYKLYDSAEFAALTHLEALMLHGVRFKAGSIRCLAKLPRLRVLEFSNWYALDDVAWLAGKMAHVECSLFQPVTAKGLECRKCGKIGVQLSGALRACLCCKECDSKKIAAHIARFEHVRLAAQLERDEHPHPN